MTDPVGRKIDPPAVPARLYFLLDHLLAVNFKFDFVFGRFSFFGLMGVSRFCFRSHLIETLVRSDLLMIPELSVAKAMAQYRSYRIDGTGAIKGAAI